MPLDVAPVPERRSSFAVLWVGGNGRRGVPGTWVARTWALRAIARPASASGPGSGSVRSDHAARIPAVSRATSAHVPRSS